MADNFADSFVRQLRQNVRNFLLTATLEEMRKELQISRESGDAIRARFVQEMIDEKIEEGQ